MPQDVHVHSIEIAYALGIYTFFSLSLSRFQIGSHEPIIQFSAQFQLFHLSGLNVDRISELDYTHITFIVLLLM